MLWIKAFHIIFMVSWFAGLFYMPRLFVYHAMCDDKESNERFKVMERKLFNGIMTPTSILTVVFGIWLVALQPDYYFSQGWFHAKLLLVALIAVFHVLCGHYMKQFRRDANTKSHVFFRVFNEIAILLLAGIVILVVVRPF